MGEINQPRLCFNKTSPHLSIIPGRWLSALRYFEMLAAQHSLTYLPPHTLTKHVAAEKTHTAKRRRWQTEKKLKRWGRRVGDGWSWRTKRPVYRWPGWECIGTELQNTSAVSSGTQTTDCDWPDCSQEVKPRSLRVQLRLERAQERRGTNVASQPTRTESDS